VLRRLSVRECRFPATTEGDRTHTYVSFGTDVPRCQPLENETAEAVQSETKIDVADNGCGENLQAGDGKIRAAIKHVQERG
jgi:hypothetical protein